MYGIIQKPSFSSLNLQIALYFNSLFSVFFAIIIGSCSVTKNMYYDKKVSISVIIIWSFVEPFRLFCGISGNLREKVPELATYLLISLFPQLPFVLYLAYIQPVIFPVDPILGSFMLAFLVFEFSLGLMALHKQIQAHTAQFMRLTEDET